MKNVAYVYENETEDFETTLQNALRDIEERGFKIFTIQVLSDSHGIDGCAHSAYIIYDTL